MSIDHIDHGLHISSIRSVQSHDTGQFDHIVSVCQDACPQNVSDDTPYDHYEIADDRESQENWGGSATYSTFSEAAENVTEALQSDEVGDILVHCHSGQNRSAAVCAAAIGVYDGRSFDEALEMVVDARSIVHPNDLMRAHARRFIDERRDVPI